MKKQPTFIIQQRPDGKWNLDRALVRLGVFESPAAAEEAMHRVLNPVIYHYDENGDKIS